MSASSPQAAIGRVLTASGTAGGFAASVTDKMGVIGRTTVAWSDRIGTVDAGNVMGVGSRNPRTPSFAVGSRAPAVGMFILDPWEFRRARYRAVVVCTAEE